MSWFRKLLSVAPLTLTLALGCGGDDGGTTPPPTTTITKTSTDNGDGQSGIVGQPLPLPLRVLVTESGSPVAGATVTWSTQAEGGSLNPASTPTGSDGIASTSWTLGNFAVQQSAQASLTGASGSPLIFTAQGQPGAASVWIKESGDGQSGEINTVLSGAFQVRVSDQFDNGIPGFPVFWSATNATVSAPTVPTSVSGVSQVNVTLGGTVGPVTVTATAEGLLGSPATFTAAATEPGPSETTVAVGDNFFSPQALTITAGTRVVWNWAPTARDHNVVPDGTIPTRSGNPVDGPATYQFQFDTPGTYRYYCEVHGGPGGIGMSGIVTVQ
jgi:plastocyanin